MCGIVGIVGDTLAVSTSIFQDMRDCLAHRGPDDAGTWRSPSRAALLGSRRLAILDLSPSGHQPMLNETGHLAIVFNGEIYNYVELAEELAGLGYRFRSQSDTEVVLKAFEEWGEQCLTRFNGMFAFAIWDERSQELFAARDRFGEKPFYYFIGANRDLFAFGSEIKALVVSGLFPINPNFPAIYSYLADHDIDSGAETLFRNVYALPAAHALRFSKANKSLRSWRYWDLEPEMEMRLSNDHQYAERFLEIVRDSVRLRLRSDVPVGSSLSGGLDSSTIVGLIAGAVGNRHQKTFSARFHDENFDEGKYIERVVKCSRVECFFVYPEPSRLPQEIEAVTWHQEHPFYSSSVYAQWNVMRLCRQHKVTVLLDGQGADETLAGYHSYFAAYYKDLLRQFRLPAFASSILRYGREQGMNSLLRTLYVMLPTWSRRRLQEWLRPPGVSGEFEREWAPERAEHKGKFKSVLQQSLYATLTRTILPQLLRYADRNSMAFSREVRLPFLDHRLVEFLFSIPADQKIRHTRTKVILRNAISGIVPEEIRNRKDKMGYAPPESSWLRGPLRSWAEGILQSTAFRQRYWLEPKIVNSVWDHFVSGNKQDGLQTLIWRWISLEVWAKTYLGCTSTEQLLRTATPVGQSTFSPV